MSAITHFPEAVTLDTACGYTRHPLSARFSPITERQLTRLAASIRAVGQIDDVILLNGQVLDGWGRALACERIGVALRVQVLENDTTDVDVVLARNLTRRVMTDSARAISVVDMYFDKNEASQACGEGSSAAPSSRTHWTEFTAWRLTKQQLADLADVSVRLMQDALRLRQSGAAEVVDAVRSGQIPLETAIELLRQPKHFQAECLTKALVDRDEAKVERKSNQKEAAALKKAGLLLGDPSMSTAERLQASRHLPGENSRDEVNAFEIRNMVREDWEEFVDASSLVDLCCSLLSDPAKREALAESEAMLVKSCTKFLGLSVHWGGL